MASQDDKLIEPQVIAGRYRLDDRFADGHFAQVWRAYDTQLQRPVAVKIFKPNQTELAESFQAESVRTLNLKHPGIVPIHDAGCDHGTYFVVSDFIEGGSLRDFVGRQIWSPQQVVKWMTDVAEALEYAHENGVVHRNIKPTNILVNLDGRALLADFGIAGTRNQQDKADFAEERVRYQSPEQLEGKVANEQSDVYSLGVVLHELLTGALPYQSSDPHVLRFEILRGAQLNTPSIPFELRHICRKALERDPRKRYSSIKEFDIDLRRTSAGTPTRRMMIAAAGVVLFFVGFGISAWFSGDTTNPIPAEPLAEAEWLALTGSLSAKDLTTAVANRLSELNPGFQGELTETIEDGAVVELVMVTDQIKNLSPIRALKDLRVLNCFGTYTEQSNGRLADLSPLKGLKLTRLTMNDNERIDDLSPLEGMPLTFLNCRRTNVSELTSLNGMPLTILVCGFTNVSNLTPLVNTKLKELYCDHTGVADLSPLHGMPLEQLHCQDTPVTSLAAVCDSPLKVLDCNRTLITDLKPLQAMKDLVSLNVLSTRVDDLSPLKNLPNIKLLWADLGENRGAEIVRSLTSLEFINDNPVSEFWQEYDRSRQ